MAERRRVVVTGLGMASAIGLDEATVWDNLRAGRGGIGRLRALDTTGYRIDRGAEVDAAEVQARLKNLKRRPVDRALDLALIAAADALEQAGLIDGQPPHEPQDVGVIFGTGVGSAQSHHTAFTSFFKRGPKGLRPSTVPKCMYNAISAGLSIHFGLTGPNYIVVSACTSATNAIGTAFRQVRDGYADTVLCGGADSFFDPFFFGVWNNLGVLSTNPDPERACRPFDADRDGCVLGEGAGVLVIETLDRARARGSRIRGEILGYGESSDASHLTTPSVDGQAKAMRRALDEAGVAPDELGMINAHGTATRSNDVCESHSIRQVLGAAADRVPVVANKSYFGHTLGASGALETIATLLSLEARLVPPNLNLETRDPECDVTLAGSEPAPMDAPLAMKNSFGFGGGNGVLVLRRSDPEEAA
ncbi:MAG: beta-ketoacyl-[acyl-carrier-protein] synthase family protein [Thermoanaerobaculia bacterium]